MKRPAVNSYPNFSDARVKDAQFPRFFDLSLAFYRRGDLEVLRGGALLKFKHFYRILFARNPESATFFLRQSYTCETESVNISGLLGLEIGIETEVSPSSFVTMVSLPVERRVVSSL